MKQKLNSKKWRDVEKVISIFFGSRLIQIPNVKKRGLALLIEVKKQIYKDEGLVVNFSLGDLRSSEILLSREATEKFQNFIDFASELLIIEKKYGSKES